MKKLLASTALCLVFSTSISGAAQAQDIAPATYVVQEASATITNLYTLAPAVSLYQGDFQQITRAISTHSLYTGAGSALMPSMRNVTD